MNSPKLFASLLMIATLGVCAPGLTKEVPERDDIASQYKWDLTDMYADAAAWDADR